MSTPVMTLKQKQTVFRVTELCDVTKGDKVTHQIRGVCTCEEVDSDGEICDYADTKPYYQEWSEKRAAQTTAAGQDPSYGNVRVQHTLEIGGKVTALEYDDDNKCIKASVEPFSEDIWRKAKKGFFSGFSHSGDFAYRRCDECGTEVGPPGEFVCPKCMKVVHVRYACVPNEISLVDVPASPSSVITHVKVDGSREVIKSEAKTKRVAGEDLPSSAFAYVGDPDEVGTWHYPIKFNNKEKTVRHVRNALSQWRKPKGQVSIPESERPAVYARIVSAARRNGVTVSQASSKALESVADKVQKSLYHIGWSAEIVSSIRNLRDANFSEAIYEEDERDAAIAEELQGVLEAMIGVSRDIFDEEMDEVAAVRKAAVTKGVSMNEQQLQLLKAAKKGLHLHFTKSAAHHEAMAEHHKALHEEHLAAVETHKAQMEDPECKAMHPFHKAMQAHHKAFAASQLKLAKSHMAHAAHHTAMAAAHAEEAGKAAAPAVEVVKTEATGEVVKAVAAPAASATPATPSAAEPTELQSIVDSMVQKALTEAVTRVQGSAEVQKAIDETVAKALMGRLGDRIVPTQLKTAGLELVPRNHNDVNKAAGNDLDTSMVPLELADMVELDLQG